MGEGHAAEGIAFHVLGTTLGGQAMLSRGRKRETHLPTAALMFLTEWLAWLCTPGPLVSVNVVQFIAKSAGVTAAEAGQSGSCRGVRLFLGLDSDSAIG